MVVAFWGYVHASRYAIARAAPAAIAMADFHGPRNVTSKHAPRPDRLMATKNHTNYS
jgi:hypothetical protein